jgi:hypothetical protein
MDCKWELPLKYDDLNDCVVDANSRTVAILAWNGCSLDLGVVKSRALVICDAINGIGNVEYPPIPLQTQVIKHDNTSVSALTSGVKSIIDKVFRKNIEVKNKYYTPVVRKYVDVSGVVHEVKGRGRAKRGWIKYSGDIKDQKIV